MFSLDALSKISVIIQNVSLKTENKQPKKLVENRMVTRKHKAVDLQSHDPINLEFYQTNVI